MTQYEKDLLENGKSQVELDILHVFWRNQQRVEELKKQMGTKLVTHPQSTFTPKKQPVLAGSRLVF